MRYLLLLLGLISTAYGQFAPTSAKTAFKNGISIGTRDSTAYTANDSLVVVINRQGRMMYRSTDGYWKILSNAAASDYVPYTGAVDNVNLGNFRLTARSLRTDSIYSNSSAGMYLLTNGGAAVAHWGGGGSVEVDFKGFAGYDANRSASYTARSFTDKGYVDSADALRLLISDTAAMLSPYLRKTDTTGLLSNVVRTFGDQTVGGIKTFSSTLFGTNAIVSTRNAGAQVPLYFAQMTTSALNDSSVVMLGRSATNTYNLFDFTMYQKVANQSTGSLSVNLFDNGGKIRLQEWTRDGTTITRPLTINGNLTATSIIRNGGTSSQFLKADGSVDGTSYATAASLSGYLPLTAGSGNTITGTLYINSSLLNSNSTYLDIYNNTADGSDTKITRIGGGGDVTNNRGANIDLRGNEASGAGNLYLNAGVSGTIIANALINGTSLSMSGDIATATRVAADVINGYTGGSTPLTIQTGGTQNLVFGTNATERARIATDGTFLINTTTTDGTNKLIVNGGVKGTTGTFSSTITGTNGGLYLQNSAANSAVIGLIIEGTYPWQKYIDTESGQQSYGEYIDGGIFYAKTVPYANRNSAIASVGTDIYTLNLSTGAATFSSSVTANTNTTIGNSNPVYNGNSGTALTMLSSTASWIELATSSTTDGNGGIITVNNTNIAGSDKRVVAFGGIRDGANNSGAFVVSTWNAGSAAERLRIAPSGAATFSSSVTATGFVVSSSKTLKDVYYRNKQLDGIDFVGYTWKKNLNLDKKKHLGFIAEEVEKVMPDAVSANDKGVKAVNYTEVLIYKLEKLTERVEELESEVKRLKRKRN